MKTLFFACAFCVLGAVAARADLTVVQKVEGPGEDVENTYRVKAGKTRMDTTPGTSIIMDLKTGEMISLVHTAKIYVKVSGETARKAIEGIKQPQGSAADPKPTLAPTGKKETISGFAADEYTCTVAGGKMTLWLTRALPDYELALKEASGALGQGPLMQSDGIDMATLPGFPIRTVLEVRPGETMTRTVLSVSTKPVADSEFEIPADYKEVMVPVLTPPEAGGPSPTPSR